MHPIVRRNFPLFGQLYHMHRRRVSPLLARSIFQRGFKLSYRCVPWTANRIERDAGPDYRAFASDGIRNPEKQTPAGFD
jgi:hypothetical protein